MTLKIKKIAMKSLNLGNRMILFIILWNVLAPILIGFFHFPRALLYITDIFNIVLFLNTIYIQAKRKTLTINSTVSWILIFITVAIISTLINFTSPLLAFWGMRQNFRFFLFFYSCVEFLNEKTLRIILKIIQVVFWISLPLCVYEALFVQYPVGTIIGDMVGGIYYRVGSANAPLNVILIINSFYIMLRCVNGKVSFGKLILTLTAAIYMAILAELKLFLLEIIIITLYVLITNKINWKIVALCLSGILVFSFVITTFVSVNARGRSYYTENFFSLKSMIEYVTRAEGYDGVGDLNRFTAIESLWKMFFSKDKIGLLFGYGIGSADFSNSFDALTSSFYRNYSYLHYQYFSHAFIFIETGLLGLLSYIMIYTSSLRYGIKKLRKSEWRKFYVFAVFSMLFLLFYNTTLRNELCAYILYAILAIPHAKKFDFKRLEKE